MASYRYSYQDISGQNLQAPSNLRALICFQLPQLSLPKLRFLRVLHIENSKLEDLSSAIKGCIHLRCLRLIECGKVTLPWLIECGEVTLPSSMGNLIYLQTIDMRGTYCTIPKSMWDISSLRHVHLSYGFYPPKIVQSKELQTFSLVTSDKFCNLRMVRCLGQMTQLTTFSLIVDGDMPAEVMKIFSNMPCLVDLHLSSSSVFEKLPESHHFPQSLRSFTLHVSDIEQDLMPVLETLQCLVMLKLFGYRGQTISCSARGFPRLQNLELCDFFNIEEWKIEAGAMPKLSHMKLDYFANMSKLPQGLLHLQSLKHLEVAYMPLISIQNDATLKELQQKGCEVITSRVGS